MAGQIAAAPCGGVQVAVCGLRLHSVEGEQHVVGRPDGGGLFAGDYSHSRAGDSSRGSVVRGERLEAAV